MSTNPHPPIQSRPGRKPLPVCDALHCTTKLHADEERKAGLCMRHIQSGAPLRKAPTSGSAVRLGHPTQPVSLTVPERALDDIWHDLSPQSKAWVISRMVQDVEHGRFLQPQ